MQYLQKIVFLQLRRNAMIVSINSQMEKRGGQKIIFTTFQKINEISTKRLLFPCDAGGICKFLLCVCFYFFFASK